MLSKAYITRLLDGRVRVLPRTEIFCGLEEKIFPASRIRVPRSAIFYGLGQKKTQKKFFARYAREKVTTKNFLLLMLAKKLTLKNFSLALLVKITPNRAVRHFGVPPNRTSRRVGVLPRTAAPDGLEKSTFWA